MHKFVLAAYSDVFRAMFRHKETIENIQSRMEITDFDADTVDQMLEYLYTGEFSEELDIDNLAEILKIAEKYQLELLKSISEEKLITRFYF